MKDQECKGNIGSILLAFVLGGMVGAGIAILLAPRSGAETRKRIREFAEEVKDNTSDHTGQAKENISEYYSQTKNIVSSGIEKAKNLYDEKKSAITSAIEAGKEAYQKEVHK